MLRTTLTMPWLLAIATVATLIPSPVLAVPPHSSEGECADHVVDQYNKDGDEDGLKFGLQDCNDAYATEGEDAEVGGALVLLPPYGSRVPQSLSESSSSSDEPRRR